jgi:hypothetical protein
MLGIMASAISGNLFAPSGAYESIATSAGGSVTITLSSIPSTYQHLQLRAMVRVASGASGNDDLGVRLNSDTGSNYSWHWVGALGSTAYSDNGVTQTSMQVRDMLPRNGSTAGIYGVLILDILDYKDTTKYKTIRTFGGVDQNGNGTIALNSGLWQSTSAVTSISIFDRSTTYTFTSDSSFALYGIKGA